MKPTLVIPTEWLRPGAVVPIDAQTTGHLVNMVSSMAARIRRADTALSNIRDLVEGRIDVNDGDDGPEPNIFARIDIECAVGLGEAP